MTFASFGMSKQNEIALDQHLSVGTLRNMGKFLNSVKSGFYTNFQGCYFSYLGTAGTSGDRLLTRLSLDTATDPYIITGPSQLMSVRVSDAAAVTTAGFPDAAASGDRGVLRLTNNDTNTTAVAMALTQENALWIAPSTNFTAIFDIAQWTQRSDAITTQWAEFGVVGSWTLSDALNSAREPGYNNGTTTDTSYASIKLGATQGRLVYKAATGGTAVTSAAFDVPPGSFSIRLEYNHATNGGSPTIAVFVNNVFKLAVASALAGPFQLFSRTCHSATYASATQAPVILDIDAIAVAIPN